MQPQNTISDHLCECGCGQFTRITLKSRPRRHLVKGQPQRFISGHYKRSLIPWEERFWQFVHKTDTCWLWTGTRDGHGYGFLWVRRRHVRATRLSYALHHGSIPEGLSVCHHCDTPPCVRPDHLFAGTPKDNMDDRQRKGRQAKGERYGNTKLTASAVLRIRELYVPERGILSALAWQFGCTPTNIREIILRRTWKHI